MFLTVIIILIVIVIFHDSPIFPGYEIMLVQIYWNMIFWFISVMIKVRLQN